MEMIGALTLIFCFQLLGETISHLFGLPIPGPVIGMLLLFAWLSLRGQLSEGLERASSGLLDNLTLLFVPAGVGLILYIDQLREHWLGIAIVLILSTAITIVGTALTLQFLQRLPVLLSHKRREEAHE
jgi:holin-like protein